MVKQNSIFFYYVFENLLFIGYTKYNDDDADGYFVHY